MKNIYTLFFRKTVATLFAVIIIVLNSGITQAQTYTIGSGTNQTYQYPINSLYGYSYTQSIYTAASLTAQGMTSGMQISKIRWYIYSSAGTTYNNNWTIYLGNTSTATFSSNNAWITTANMTQVFSGTTTWTTGWMEVTLSTPFTWTGNNLVVAADENTASYTYPVYFYYTTGVAQNSIQYYSDGTNPDPAAPPTASGRNNYLPNIQLVVESACSGTPNPGNTILTAGTNPTCSGVSFTLGLQNVTTGSGVTYDWQSSDNNSFTGASPHLIDAIGTSSTLTTSETATTYYRCKVTCSGNTGTSNSIQVSMNSPSNCYCTANATTCDEYISRVQCGSIDNSTTCTSGGYADYTASSTAMTIGTGYAATITNGTPYSTDQCGIWIDWNQDGDFDDANETITITGTPGLGPYTATITPPVGALSGNTRMRIRICYTTGLLSCGTTDYGEVEDYTVNIAAPAACSGIPTAGTAGSTPQSICSGNTATMSVSGYTTGVTGITLQWQQSANGTTGWVNVSGGTGGTTASYTTSAISTTTYYRCAVTCTPSSQTDYTNNVEIDVSTTTPPTATNSSQCGTQVPTASVSGNNGQALPQFNWYSASSGGTLLQAAAGYSGALATYYTNNFSSGIGTATLSGSATLTGGVVQLTPNTTSQLGGLTVPASGKNSDKLKVNFDLITSIAAQSGADGLSYSFADDADATASSPNAEDGTGTKLAVSFDEYGTSGGGISGIRVLYGTIMSDPDINVGTNGVLAYSSNTSWAGTTAAVEISIDASGLLTLKVAGTTIFSNVQLPPAYVSADKSTWKHVIKARTGGVTNIHSFDNLVIQQSALAAGYNTYLSPVSATTTFYVSESIGSSCATSRTAVTVTVNPAPTISGTTILCGGGATTTLTGSITPGTWSSSNTGVATINSSTGLVTSVAAGTTNITYTVTATGCTATTVVTVGNSPAAPTAVTAIASSICIGASTNLNATSAGNSIFWYTASTGGTLLGSSASGVNFPITPASTGTYTYYAEANSGGVAAGSQTFNYSSNAVQSFTLPTGVTSISVQLWGAGGGSGYLGGSTYIMSGGSGAYMTGTLTGLTGGTVLQITVPHGGYYSTSTSGGAGGWPGGGAGGYDANVSEYGGGGGGYAAIQIAGTYYALVGGGGGGGTTEYGGDGSGGGGGATTGGTGGIGGSTTGGGGGTISSGGAAGITADGSTAGTAFTGGNGGNTSSLYEYGGGGGGAGYYGGGAGNAYGGGGGGGSSYPGSSISGFTLISNLAGTNNTSSGIAQAPGAPPAGIGNGNYAANGGNGLVIISWSAVAGCPSTRVPVSVTVNPLPTVAVTPTSANYCTPPVTAVTLTASGASTYAWANATGLDATTGTTVHASPATTTIYTVTGTDSHSCTNTATTTITATTGVTLSATATPSTICGAPNSTQLQATASQSGLVPIFSENFDGTTTWTVAGNFAIGAPGAGNTATTSYSGTNILGTDLNGNYVINLTEAANYAYTQTINCTGYTGVTLTYYSWSQFEGSSYDWGLVYVSNNNGSTWTQVESLGTYTESGWTLHTVDISAYANNQAQVKIKYTMYSDGSVNFTGWNIDNLSISGMNSNFTYSWSPATSLSSTTIANPVGTNLPSSTTYTVTATSPNGCTNTATDAIIVNPLPTITTAASATSVCYNAGLQTTPLTYSATTNTPTTYSITWNPVPANSFVAVTNATLPVSPITISVPAGTAVGTYTGTITVKNANGCVSTGNTFTLTVNALPSITTASAAANACFSTSVQTTPLTYSATTNTPTTYSIAWNALPSNSFVPVTDAALAASPILISVPANPTTGVNYTGNITVKNANGCVSASTPFTVLVNPLPTITLAATATSICYSAVAQTTPLSYSAVTNSPTTYSIVWNSSPANSFAAVTDAALPGSPFTISVPAGTAAGTYTGTLTVKNANGCVSTGSSFTVTVNPLPTITTAASATAVCYSSSQQSTPLTYSATTNSPTTYSITWNPSPANSFAAVTNATLNASPISITVPGSTNPGTYTGTITVANGNSCVSTGTTFTITVNALPTITTAATSSDVCYSAGAQTTPLTYSATTSSPTTYSIVWNPSPANSFAAVTNAALPASPITIAVPAGTPVGTYTGTISVANANGCVGGGTNFTVTVNPLPTITSGGTAATVCFSGSAQQTTMSYTSTSQSPTSYSIDWNAAANAAGLPDQGSTAFVFASGGGTITGINIAAGLIAGTYNGTMTVTNANSCNVIQSISVIVNPTPTASISGTTMVCAGSSPPDVTFTNPMALAVTITYNINGSSQTTINVGANSTNTVGAPTTTAGTFVYNLVSIVYQSSPVCNNTISGSATIIITPNISAVNLSPTATQTVCFGGAGTTGTLINVSETGGGVITARQWKYGSAAGGPFNNLISGATGATYTPSGPDFSGGGTWYVVCTSTPTCGPAMTTSPVTVIVIPNASKPIITSTLLCGGTTVSGTTSEAQSQTITIYDGVTDIGHVDIPAGQSTWLVTVSPALVAGASITAQISNTGVSCSSLPSDPGIVMAPVPGTVSGFTPLCVGYTTTYVSTGGVAGGVWSSSNTGAATVDMAGHVTGVGAGSAIITYTVAYGTCIKSSSQTVNVVGAITPTISAGTSTSFCDGGSVVLTANNGISGSNYLWSTGETTSSITVTNSGNYTVGINTTGCGNVSSAPTTVTVYAKPVGIILVNGVPTTTTFCAGQNALLSAVTSVAGSGTITGYQWWFNDGTTNSAIGGATSSTYSANAPGVYSVVITDSNGCTTVACP